MYLAWRYGGACPYRTYNGLDESYRPLAGDACPDCDGRGWSLARRVVDLPDGTPEWEPYEKDCLSCAGAGTVIGPPRRPLFPARVRAFVYACGLIADMETKALAGVAPPRRQQLPRGRR